MVFHIGRRETNGPTDFRPGHMSPSIPHFFFHTYRKRKSTLTRKISVLSTITSFPYTWTNMQSTVPQLSEAVDGIIHVTSKNLAVMLPKLRIGLEHNNGALFLEI